MSFFKGFALTAAVVSLSIAPAVAQAAPQASSASKLSLRAHTAAMGGSKMHGSTAIVAILALAAIIGGIIVATKGKGVPKSP